MSSGVDHDSLTEIMRFLHHRVCELEYVNILSAIDKTGVIPKFVRIEILDDIGDPETMEAFKSKTTTKPVRGVKPYVVTPEMMATINYRNNLYWSKELRTPVNFQLAASDIFYNTLSDTALFRNTFLSKFFVDSPVVVDAYAGVGMDTISFLHNLGYNKLVPIKRLFCIENNDDRARNERLIHNVQEYIRARGQHTAHRRIMTSGQTYQPDSEIGLEKVVDFYLNGTELFFKNCKKFKLYPVNEIDLLYVDPPWTLPDRPNSGTNGEATSSELLQFMYDTIFEHLIDSNVRVRLICIKTRFNWNECSPFIAMVNARIPDENLQFVHVTTLSNNPFKGVYYFHVIKTMEAEYGDYRQSDLFKETYKDKKKGDDYTSYMRPEPGADQDKDTAYRPGQDPLYRRSRAPGAKQRQTQRRR